MHACFPRVGLKILPCWHANVHFSPPYLHPNESEVTPCSPAADSQAVLEPLPHYLCGVLWLGITETINSFIYIMYLFSIDAIMQFFYRKLGAGIELTVFWLQGGPVLHFLLLELFVLLLANVWTVSEKPTSDDLLSDTTQSTEWMNIST